jgi:hypothetical protein
VTHIGCLERGVASRINAVEIESIGMVGMVLTIDPNSLQAAVSQPNAEVVLALPIAQNRHLHIQVMTSCSA